MPGLFFVFGALMWLSVPKTSSVQLMLHAGTHGVPRRAGRGVVCEGWRFGQEPGRTRASPSASPTVNTTVVTSQLPTSTAGGYSENPSWAA
jgi:hypothetical protein